MLPKCIVITSVFGWAVTVRAQTPAAAVEGGADASGHQYEWTVTNRRSSPIRSVEFPHHAASVFLGPEQWKIRCTNLVGIGVKDPIGVCTATVESESVAIGEGRSASFRMQIAGGGAKRGTGSIVVRFADGSHETIGGVAVPTAEGSGDRNVPLIGMGIVLAILIASQVSKRRRLAQADKQG